MEEIRHFLEGHKALALGGAVVGGAVVGALGVLGWTAFHKNDAGPLTPPVDPSSFTKKNHVYLLIPPRLGAVPSISPFCVKLETWFRMANIPYEVVETMSPSPSKQTFPYIYLNGEETADSRFIIEKCAQRFGKRLDNHLTEMEKAIFVAYSHMIEEHFVITYAWHRYTLGADTFWKNFMPYERLGPMGKRMAGAREFMRKGIQERAWLRGIGRHSPEEIYRLAEEDLQSLSTYLGNREFFFGREPSVIDCTLFAHLCQLLCLDVDFPPKKKLQSEWKNLADYVQRIKIRFYPDWNLVCSPKANGTDNRN
ncbi:failed axon connections homolog [Liolophura sinensis]|uniref:failed axon connections homolog n=1 Tax=Liolophura sinensis TaxID=3198878 RepID=UPI003159112D